MAVPRIRADYDQLGQVAQRFGAASDAAATTMQSLQQNMQVLEGGDWVGEGARAFYQEMSQSVLPAMKRLTHALQAAQQATQAISRGADCRLRARPPSRVVARFRRLPSCAA